MDSGYTEAIESHEFSSPFVENNKTFHETIMRLFRLYSYCRKIENDNKTYIQFFDFADTVVILNLPNNLVVQILFHFPTTSRVDEVRDREEHLLLKEDGEDSLPLPVPHDLALKDDWI